MAIPYLATTIATGILIIPYVGIAKADLPLKVPMAGEGQLIAISETGSGERALITAVFHGLAEVDTAKEETGDGNVDVGNVELPGHGVHS